MNQDNENLDNDQESPESKLKQLLERQILLKLVSDKADINAKTEFELREKRDKERFQMMSGRFTSLIEERLAQQRILSEYPQDHEPKFRDFFIAIGNLLNWSQEQQDKFRKDRIAPDTINETVYDRFPEEVVRHIHAKNPYIKWCMRKHKNYRFLGEDAILDLEKYIYEAILIMQESISYYEFRYKHAQKYGTNFQPELFGGQF